MIFLRRREDVHPALTSEGLVCSGEQGAGISCTAQSLQRGIRWRGNHDTQIVSFSGGHERQGRASDLLSKGPGQSEGTGQGREGGTHRCASAHVWPCSVAWGALERR